MALSQSDLHRGSTTAYSTLVKCETLDIIFPRGPNILKPDIKTTVLFPRMICYFGNDKLVAFDQKCNRVGLYEDVCNTQNRSSSIIHSLPNNYCYTYGSSTALDGNRFAISCPYIPVLTIFSSENTGQLKEDGKLNIGGKCYDIDYINGKLVVCFRDPPKISVLDMKTGFIHSIENEPKGNQLFNVPSHVAIDICNGQEMIYVSDNASWGLRRLTKIDLHGNMLASFLSLEEETPKQVITVGDGNILFVHKGIRLMSENCQEVVKLLDESHTASVLCMSYSKQRNLLFVVKDKSSEIVVYKLT
ncbi:uncharacterized protein LOC128206950 [Mya arenaria]|uniref:uncharacterized protein LOC128206950 n=1 Tax=Mya arenaria TaxID=6604 RepID=UPI0022E6AE69|nr:uncharacterized protein LOC128206950 [Mya arenaria]XP_052765656.1 uncharacterized protein LOC128206950 [Mya arenaria]